MLFRIFSVLSLLALAGRLTYLRFRHDTVQAGARSGSLSWAAYFRWLGRGLATLFRPAGWQWLRATYAYCCALYSPPMLRWIFIVMSASFLYLAASGFALALLSPRGLFGIPLLLHVVAGGVFAVSLAADVIVRAKEYSSIIEVFTAGGRPMGYLLGLFSRPIRQSVLFWVFVLSGLALIATALFSMLPYFSFRTQVGLVETHRWAALAAVLAAMAFFDSIIPRREA
jgi:hypothetical protein